MSVHPQLVELVGSLLPVVEDFHNKALFAPHAATINAEGEMSGHALTTDGSVFVSGQQAISLLESNFRKRADAGEIVGSCIFYPSPGVDRITGKVDLSPAVTADECSVLVAAVEHVTGDSVHVIFLNRGTPGAVDYESAGTLDRSRTIFVPIPVPLPGSALKSARPWWKVW